jgi:hypothetical protein
MSTRIRPRTRQKAKKALVLKLQPYSQTGVSMQSTEYQNQDQAHRLTGPKPNPTQPGVTRQGKAAGSRIRGKYVQEELMGSEQGVVVIE